MAQRFDDLLSPRKRLKRKRGSSKSATLLLFLDTPAAIILLHPVKVVPKVWYLVRIGLIEALLHLKTATDFFCPVGARGLCINCVTAFRVSSSAAGLSCTGLKCHVYNEFNTAKRSFIHVCLLIALFSMFVFGCLESDDRSCGDCDPIII